MVSAARWISLLMLVSCVIAIAGSQPRMSKREVLAIAERAIAVKFPWSVAKHYKYDAFYLSDGTWGVYVPHPGQPDLFGGGEPNAEIRDRDGKVLKAYLAR